MTEALKNYGIKPNEFRLMSSIEWNAIKNISKSVDNKIKEIQENEKIKREMEIEMKNRFRR